MNIDNIVTNIPTFQTSCYLFKYPTNLDSLTNRAKLDPAFRIAGFEDHGLGCDEGSGGFKEAMVGLVGLGWGWLG